MNIKKCLFIPFLLLNLISCSTPNNETYKPETDLEEIFYRLKDNNFSLGFEDSFVNFDNITRRASFYYTEYSVQSEGDLGFSGLAYDEDKNVVFKYNIKDDEIVTGAPLVNYYNGLRYESIYEYTYGLQDFDLSYLPKEKDSDGYYHYEFGNHLNNDKTFLAVFLREGYSGIFPEEVKIKVVNGVMTIESVILSYWDDLKDTVKCSVYDIGKTENKEIKKYLDDGKSSKDPLDLDFYKLMNSYMSAINYTVDMYDHEYLPNNKFLTEYCTDSALYDEFKNGKAYGYMLTQGAVVEYSLINEKVNIASTPYASEENDFFTDIYGGVLAYSFFDITYDVLIGYKDDVNPSLYHITDTYFIYIFGYLCGVDIYETNYCDEILIEIKDNNSFIATLNIYNKQTNVDLGKRICEFYNLGTTRLKEVEEYLSLGEEASNQTKDDLKEVLDKLKGHNYSTDLLTAAGLSKIYNTQNYFYQELYGNPSNNYGYIKQDGGVYKFNIINNNVVVDLTKNYASGNNPMNIPSIGSAYGFDDDLGYISMFEGIYNVDNYQVAELNGLSYWSLTDEKAALDIYNYICGIYSNILPHSSGFVISNNNENSKLTLISAYMNEKGTLKDYFSFTFYDIGYTSNEIIDNYLSSL